MEYFYKISPQDLGMWSADSTGRTCLHWAAARGSQTSLLLLCHQTGCDLNVRDFTGRTPLHWAAVNGHESCVKALLYYAEQARFRLDLNGADGNGDTALHLASKWGYGGIVRLLIQWDADREALNARKQKPIDSAQNVRISRALAAAESSDGGGGFWRRFNSKTTMKFP